MVEEHREQAASFEKWYADMTAAPAKDEIQQRHLGLPPHLLSTSLLTWHGIEEVAEALQLAPGDLLVDLACGRGGYGLELASRTRARLLGIDFAPSALEAARTMRKRAASTRTTGWAIWLPPASPTESQPRSWSSMRSSSPQIRRPRIKRLPGFCALVVGSC